jgi:hypothetical protein
MLRVDQSPSEMKEILMLLGGLQADVRQTARAVERLERQSEAQDRLSSESRARVHERLDLQATVIAEIEIKIERTGHVAAQQRDMVAAMGEGIDQRIAGLTKRIDAEIQPAVQSWRQMQTLGFGFAFIATALGVTGATVAFYLGETAKAFARKWLGIG